MTLMRMPVFTWMTLIISLLLVFAFPVLTVGLIELMFMRFYEMPFFNANQGGDPILWQHLFWIFGHPEVYILILPAWGIVGDMVSFFTRKPHYWYKGTVFATVSYTHLTLPTKRIV